MRARDAALQSGSVAVADAPSARPPTPEECDHPAPVEGVLAHEFAHYDGAIGPEGTRRTVTYYGPVIGGLPIQAWHCEVCGLLRLTFPDGRKEERRLFPGPQPGLMAAPSAIAPERVLFGLQARVSGLSAQPAYMERLVEQSGFGAAAPALHLPRVALPDWDSVTWLMVLGLVGITSLLFAMGILAVYTFSTPSVEVPLAITTTLAFAGLILFRLGVAAVRHFFPAQQLAPSVADALRSRPALDGATRAVVVLMSLSLVGFFAAGILAVYTFSTPGAEWPVILMSLAFAVTAVVVKVAAVAWHHFFRG